jgi:hypothetical protein
MIDLIGIDIRYLVIDLIFHGIIEIIPASVPAEIIVGIRVAMKSGGYDPFFLQNF